LIHIPFNYFYCLLDGVRVKENGFYNITLNVYEGNKEAYAFYLKKEMFKRKTMMEIIV